jgi:superfamily II DNA/RNA helicase
MPSPTVKPTQEQLDNLAVKAEAAFGYRPCLPQLLSAWYQLQGRNVFTIAWTGFGKTLTFWLPLLEKPDGVLIIVTPLNILAEKTAKEVMERLGIEGIAVTSANADNETFRVRALQTKICMAS